MRPQTCAGWLSPLTQIREARKRIVRESKRRGRAGTSLTRTVAAERARDIHYGRAK